MTTCLVNFITFLDNTSKLLKKRERMVAYSMNPGGAMVAWPIGLPEEFPKSSTIGIGTIIITRASATS